MSEQTHNPAQGARRGWQELAEFQGAPQAFWAQLAHQATQAAAGELGVVYLRQRDEQGQEAWSAMASWPELAREKLPALFDSVAAGVLAAARAAGVGVGPAANGAWRVGVLALSVEAGQHELVLVVHVPGADAGGDDALRFQLAPFQCLPRLYEYQRRQHTDERDNARLVQAIELLGRIMESDSFERAALVFVNDLAERFACESVAICWRERTGLVLRALSHADKVERRTEVSQLLEEAGQEALDQGCEIAWPASAQVIARAHQQYADLQLPGHLLTLPLRVGEAQRGAVTLARRRMPFTAAEQWALRLMCEVALPALTLLHADSQALPKRLWAHVWRSVPERFKALTRDGRRLAQTLAIGTAAVLLMPLPYWVNAGAIIKTDAMAYVGAPFDGYLEKGQASLGATVNSGDVLFEMATRELALERASVLADLAQYAREAEKRRASNQLPEMQIAEAQAAQAAARLKLVDFRLETAKAKSPIAGIVIEGEPGKNLGGAVRRGDTVVKVAAVQGLYVEAAVDERDIGRVAIGASTRLTLLADTGKTYRMRTTRIVPAASVKDGANTFPVRIELQETLPEWWRPGMSGVVKIDVGLRPLVWIVTHRLVDYLSLLLWI